MIILIAAFVFNSQAYSGTAESKPSSQKAPAAVAPKTRSLAATRQCLEQLVAASGRTDIDVLQNGDLAIISDKGIRIERSNDRSALVDFNGNCGHVDLGGKSYNSDRFSSIILKSYSNAADKRPFQVCAFSDQEDLRTLVWQPGFSPLPQVSPQDGSQSGR